MFRHAFLVLEHKKSGSSTLARHILCAESDFERDEWIDALICHVNVPDDEPSVEPNTPTTQHSKDTNTVLGKFKKLRKTDKRHKSTYDFPNNDSVPVSRKTFEISGTEDARFSDPAFAIKQQRSNSDPAISPIVRPPPRDRTTPLRPSKTRLNSNDEPISNDSGFETNDTTANDNPAARSSIISLKQGQGDSEHQIWSPEDPSKPNHVEKESTSAPVTSASTSRQSRAARRLTGKLTGWGKKNVHTPDSNEDQEANLPIAEEVKEPPRQLQFAIPLQQAIDATRSTIPIELPAVVYRCIEYLDAKNAVLEEGIYRQSGSTAVIDDLRDRFDKGLCHPKLFSVYFITFPFHCD
jgi:hypothetical protein